MDTYINRVLVSESNQQILKQSDAKYRESVYLKFSKYRLDTSFLPILRQFKKDSQNITNNLDRYYLSQFLESLSDTTFSIRKQLTWFDDASISFDSIQITLKVDRKKLSSILEHSQSDSEIFSLLKYGDYIKQETAIRKRLQAVFFIVGFLISYLSSLFVSYFLKHRHKRKVENLKYGTQVIDEIEQLFLKTTGDASNSGNSESITTLSEDDTKKIIALLDNLKSLKSAEKTKSLLVGDFRASQKLANEIYERSALFLAFSFLVSIFGIVIFFILLPEYKIGFKVADYIAVSIRPILVLAFLQSLSFYLLKQYKGSINDYKYFYSEASKRKKIMLSYLILSKHDEKFADSMIGMEMLRGKDEDSNIENKESEIEKLSATDLYSQYLKIISEIKGDQVPK